MKFFNLTWDFISHSSASRAVTIGMLSCMALLATPVQAQTTLNPGLNALYAKIDGIGSLVDPRNGGSCSSLGNFGCSRDELIMSGDGVNRSAGLFQVLQDSGVCNSIQLTGLPSSGAYILIKGWNERFPTELGQSGSRVYETFGSSGTVPLVTSNFWSTIAVVSKGALPLGQRTTVRATCSSGQGSSAASVVFNTAGGLGAFYLVDLETNYSAWSGNGSLISFSGNTSISDTRSGYGRNIDVVREFGSNTYSAQYFQAHSSGGNCSSVRISSSLPLAALIRGKAWDASVWQNRTGSYVQLPITIPTSSNGVPGYHLISVEPLSSTTRADIQVTCQ